MEDFLYAYNQPKKFGKYDLFLDGKITANEVVYKVLTEDNEIENINLVDKIKELESKLQTHFTFETVTELPTEGKETVIYLVANDEESGDKDSYNEYMWVKGKGFELIGSGTYAQQKADLQAEIDRASAAETVLTDNLAKEVTDRTDEDTLIRETVTSITGYPFEKITGDTLSISDELAKRVPYTLHKSVSVVGNTKDVVKLDVPESSNEAMYCPQGLIMGGSAFEAGLVTRGICGIGAVDYSGGCSKDNLYINYDGDTTYRDNRQLVLQAGNSGYNYGHNLYQYAAARGDAVKGYVDEKIGEVDEKITTEITDREALQEEVIALKSQVNMLEIRIDFLEGQNISENIETNNIEEALVDSFTQPITLNNVVISSPQNLALNKENDVNVSIGSITIDGMTYGDVQTIAEGDSFLATDTDKIFINNLGQFGEKDDDGNITKNVIKCKVNVRGNDVDGKEVNVISGVVSITLNGDYKNVETSLYSYLSVLPDGYRRVQYLESTGEQKLIVNTESFSDFIRFVVDIQFTKTELDQYQGFITSGSFFGTSANGNWLQNQTSLGVKATTDRLKITNIFDNGSVNIDYDGITGKIISNTNQTTCSIISLFSRADNYSFCRIFSVTVESKSGLVHNLIPCLNDTGTPCMYDTVSRATFYNKGTEGDFITDRTLPDGYTELEYLECNGQQFIHTGIKATNETEVFCSFELNPDVTASKVFGVENNGKAPIFRLYAPLEGRMYFYSGGTEEQKWAVGFSPVESIRYNFKGTDRYIIKNGVMSKNNTTIYTTWESLYDISIFGCRVSEKTTQKHDGAKIYQFSISRNGILQADYQPCLDDQGKPCMYDFVSNQPKYNDNQDATSDFLYVLPGTGTETFSLRRQDLTSMGSLSKYGLRRIHRLPFNFDGDMEKFITENNIKPIVKTEMPNDGKYYVPQWTQDDEIITLEWIESEPPTIDEITE